MMQIGFTRISITPDFATDLSGYGYYLDRRTTRTLDDLAVHALSLQTQTDRCLILNCDLLMLSPYLVEQGKGRISRETGLRPEQVLLLCTHTHTAPAVVQTIGCGEIDWPYLDFFLDRLVIAARSAANQLFSVRQLSFAQAAIDPIGYNRTNPEGPVDPHVYLLKFELEGHQPYLLVNHACHPVTLGPIAAISADYPGEVVKALLASGFEGMYINGFCGDIDPVSNRRQWGGGSSETLYSYGQSIFAGVRLALDRLQSMPADLAHLACPFQIALEPCTWPDIDRIFTALFSGKSQEAGDYLAGQAWTDQVKQHIISRPDPYQRTVDAQLIKIGNCVLVGAPGEIYTKIGLDLRRMTGLQLILASNANTAIGYIATDDEIKKRSYGGYTSSIAGGILPIRPGSAAHYTESMAQGIACLQEKTN